MRLGGKPSPLGRAAETPHLARSPSKPDAQAARLPISAPRGAGAAEQAVAQSRKDAGNLPNIAMEIRQEEAGRTRGSLKSAATCLRR